jgi:hypothetical protein
VTSNGHTTKGKDKRLREDYSSFLRSRKEEFRKEKGLAFFLLQIVFFFIF